MGEHAIERYTLPSARQVETERCTYAGHVAYLFVFRIMSRFAESHDIYVGEYPLNTDKYYEGADGGEGEHYGMPIMQQRYIAYCTGNEPIDTCCGVPAEFIPDGPEPECAVHTHVPWPIKFNEIRDSMDNSTAEIEFASSPLWTDLMMSGLNLNIRVDICRYKHDSGTAYTIYTGHMETMTLSNNIVSMTCGSVLAAENSDVNLYFTQRHCNHAMYLPMCGLDVMNHITVIEAGKWYIHERQNIILPEDINLDPEYWQEVIILYVAGYTDIVEDSLKGSKEVIYTIAADNLATYAEGRSITLKYPVMCYVDPEKSNLVLIPNCQLNLRRCKELFGNHFRATAWPDMPLKNYAAIDAIMSGTGTGEPRAHPQEIDI